MPENVSVPPSVLAPPRWIAPRNRVIHGVKLMCRRGVQDAMRQARADLRQRRAHVDEWLDSAAGGRAGNSASDFLLRFVQVMQAAGECPHRIKARVAEIAHRVADLALAAPRKS